MAHSARPIIALQGGDQSRSLRAQRHGWPATAVLFDHRPVLADLGVRGTARHDRASGPRFSSPALSFALLQFLVSNFHGPWLVDILASVGSIGAVVLFLRVWQPSDRWQVDAEDATLEVTPKKSAGRSHHSAAKSFAPGFRGSSSAS